MAPKVEWENIGAIGGRSIFQLNVDGEVAAKLWVKELPLCMDDEVGVMFNDCDGVTVEFYAQEKHTCKAKCVTCGKEM